MAEQCVLSERKDGYTVITLNRPDKLNAFNVAQHEQLKSALSECQADAACRAVLLTGAGRGFCAGQDLSDRDSDVLGDDPDLGAAIEAYYNPLVRQIRALDMPVVCAVNGVAAGAGANEKAGAEPLAANGLAARIGGTADRAQLRRRGGRRGSSRQWRGPCGTKRQEQASAKVKSRVEVWRARSH